MEGDVVRVDQVGYRPDDVKQAFLLARTECAPDSRFTLVDSAGRTVFQNAVGASRGAWNAGFKAVHPLDFTSFETPGAYAVEVGEVRSAEFRIDAGASLLRGVLDDLVVFFQVQRDGADVVPVMGRAPSHLTDRRATVYELPEFTGEGFDEIAQPLRVAGGPVDVEGGWFDAGDYLKFTHATAYSLVAMLYAQRAAMGEHAALAAETRHGLAWLDKVWDAGAGVLYMQVGIGTGNESLGFVGDHELWRLPEDDDELNVSPGDRAYFVKHRPVFRAAAPGEPISPNLAGRVSAAFGLASQLAAQDGDRDRAQALLDKGASLLAAARTVDVGQLLTALPHAYYPEHSWHDDMELGAVELAIAAQLLGDARELAWTEQAVRWAQAYIASGAPDTLNVYDTSALAHVELAGLLLRQGGSAAQFAGALTDDVRRKLDLGAARAASEPFGSAIDLTEFDAVPRSLGFAATAELYCRLTGDQRYAAFGSQQTHWVLGANPWGVSFVVGSGREVPRCVHHQVANLRGPGGDGFLRGAVINGPNAAGLFDDLDELPRGCKPCGPGSADRFAPYDTASARFVDDVRAWASAEPAIDFVSTAILAFALRAE